MKNTIKRISNNQKLIIAVIFIISITISSILAFSFALLILQLFMFFVTYPVIIKKDYKSAKVYLLIYIVSTAWVFLIYYANNMAYGQPYYLGGSDDLFFEHTGIVVSNANVFDPRKISMGVLNSYTNAPFFSVYTGILVIFSNIFDGYNTFIPRVMNSYLLIWISIIFRQLLQKYGKFTEYKSLLVVVVFALTPNILYINAHIFRDTFNLFQVLASVYLFDKLFENKNFHHKMFQLILFIVVGITMYYTRKNSLAFGIILILMSVLLKNNLKKRTILLAFFVMVFSSSLLEVLNISNFQDTYNDYLLMRSGDGLSRIVFEKPLIPLGIVFRSVYAFMTPFPNFMLLFKDNSRILFDIAWLFVISGTIVQMFFTPYIFLRMKRIDWLTLSFIAWFIPVIVTTFTFRHILFYHPFLVAMAVDGFYSTKHRTRKIISLVTVYSFVLLGVVYVVLKI